MLLDDGSDESSFLYFRRFFFLPRFFFFNDGCKNDGSGSVSSCTCPFPFSSGNSVGSVSGGGDGVFVPTGIKSIGKMLKFSFPFCDGEIVKCSFPFCDGEIVKCSFPFCSGEMDSEVGQDIEIFFRSKS